MLGAGDLGDGVECTRHVCAVPGASGRAVGAGKNRVHFAEAFDVLTTSTREVVVAGASGHAPGW